MVELTARIALESMMAATADDATPIIRRLAPIPPAFTRFIGEQLMLHIDERKAVT